MRTLVIGDIHGCFTALRAMIESIGLRADDKIITLGDYIDRGTESKQVISYLIKLKEMYNMVTLKGNHEALLQAACHSRMDRLTWTNAGGLSTLLSYEVNHPVNIPQDHWDFINQCELYHETEDYIYVHGGLEPDVDLEDQSEDEMLWIRFRDLQPHKSEKTIVCGHTPQRDHIVKDIGHAICVDTHVFAKTGWLTCLEVETGRFWQTNQQLELRELHLDDFKVFE